MKQDLEAAVIFSRKYIPECDITVLVPEKVVTGKSIQDSKFFIDDIDNTKIKNMDEANYQNQEYGFYYATNINELEKKYETTNLEIILKKYMDDICMKVHYYTKFDENDFDSYLLKNSYIDEFNKQYNVNFKYSFKNEDIEKIPEESNLSSSIKMNDELAQDIVNIKKQLKNYISFQDKAIEELLKIIYNNNIVDVGNHNILISGPTGVGKTSVLKILSEYSNQPIVYCSIKQEFNNEATDIEDIFDKLLSNLYYDAISNKKINSHSIIILDDFDKLNDEENFEVQNELLHILQQGKIMVTEPQKITFDINKITFVICGNFDEINKAICVPEEFYRHDNYQLDKDNLILDPTELIDNNIFFESLLSYFQEQVLFDELDLEKARKIIKMRSNKLLKLYFEQLEKQGVRKITIDDKTIDALVKYIYTKTTNLKDFDKTITTIFKDIMFDSLKYYGKESELYINEQILQKNEKGYQFTLKNRKDML